jgi:hypothetical protein
MKKEATPKCKELKIKAFDEKIGNPENRELLVHQSQIR